MHNADRPFASCLLSAQRFTDARGTLCVAECERDIPFTVKRIFWISGIPAGAERGGHAHWSCDEAVFPVSGSFDIVLDDGRHRETFHLAAPMQGVLVKAGVWCELKNFEPETVCMVAASTDYDPSGYVHDYQAFIYQKQCR